MVTHHHSHLPNVVISQYGVKLIVMTNMIMTMSILSLSRQNEYSDYISFLVQLKVKVKVTHACPTLQILQARILEWVACPFSRGSSQPRNWPGVSCIAGGLFTNWAIRKELLVNNCLIFLFVLYQFPIYFVSSSTDFFKYLWIISPKCIKYIK